MPVRIGDVHNEFKVFVRFVNVRHNVSVEPFDIPGLVMQEMEDTKYIMMDVKPMISNRRNGIYSRC